MSDKKYEAIIKIKKTIISCKTDEHKKTCLRLIQNFQTLFKDQTATEELRQLLFNFEIYTDL